LSEEVKVFIGSIFGRSFGHQEVFGRFGGRELEGEI